MIKAEVQRSGFSMVPDLTALLDIIFIVLVFLLLTANSRVYQMDMDLPTTHNQQAQVADQPAVIQISLFQAQPAWGIAKQRYQDFAEFEAALTQQLDETAKPSVSLASEPQVPVEQLLKLLERLQQLNIETTQILMEKYHD